LADNEKYKMKDVRVQNIVFETLTWEQYPSYPDLFKKDGVANKILSDAINNFEFFDLMR